MMQFLFSKTAIEFVVSKHSSTLVPKRFWKQPHLLFFSVVF